MGKSSAFANGAFCLFPVLLGFGMLLAPGIDTLTSLALAGALFVLGIALLFAAKLPAFRQGIWLSFGAGKLPARSQQLYLAAYVCVALGCVLTLGTMVEIGTPIH